MTLQSLPPECLVQISKCIFSLRDLNAFIKTDQSVFSLLGHDLYRRDDRVADTLQWAASRGITGTIIRARNAGICLSKYPSFLRDLSANGNASFLDHILLSSPELRAAIDSDEMGLGPPLCTAISNARVQTVRVLVKHGADVNHYFGLTPLGEAVHAYRDAPETLYTLLLHGADANRVGGFGCTPLYVAAQDKGVRLSLVHLLLDSGARADAIGETGSMATPLHAACHAGSVEVASLLLDYGADVNAAANSGLVPLHFAAGAGQLALALELLERGADPNIPDNNGWRPLTLAIRHKFVEMTETLLLYGACPCEHDVLLAPLRLAIQCHVFDIVDLIVAAGADISQLDEYDMEAALEHSSPDILELLLRHLARRQCPASEQGERYAAVVGGDYVLMAADFLDVENQPSAFDVANYSALHLAAFHGAGAFVTSILEKGARPDGEGALSPLQVAAWAGNASVARQLIHHGADIQAKSLSGLSAMGGAAIEGHVELVKILLDAGASVECPDVQGDTPLHKAVQFGNVGVMEVLLERGADVHAKNALGQKAVDLSWNQPGAIDLLKRTAGVDLNERNERGETLLFKASSAGHVGSIEALFDDGLYDDVVQEDWFHPTADARLFGNVKDDGGSLPIFAALKTGNWEAIWRLLVVDDEIFKRENNEGRTLIAMATEIGNRQVLRLLLMYAMKNGLEAAWSLSDAVSDQDALCSTCKYLIPSIIPVGGLLPGKSVWASGCLTEHATKIECLIRDGIHTWQAITLEPV